MLYAWQAFPGCSSLLTQTDKRKQEPSIIWNTDTIICTYMDIDWLFNLLAVKEIFQR
jgi:hypothetical protein